MILLEFIPEKKQEYIILRDYMIERKDIKGILFVLHNPENKEVFTRILAESQISNAYVWEDVKQKDFKFLSSGIERTSGEVQKLVVEYGIMKTEKRNAVGQKKEVEYPARRYRFLVN